MDTMWRATLEYEKANRRYAIHRIHVWHTIRHTWIRQFRYGEFLLTSMTTTLSSTWFTFHELGVISEEIYLLASMTTTLSSTWFTFHVLGVISELILCLLTLMNTASRESADFFLSSSQPRGGTSTSGCPGSPSDRFWTCYESRPS